IPVLIGFPYCAATPRLRSKLPTSTLTTTNSLATSSAFLVLFSETSSARQSSHQLAPKITSTERFVVPAVARACSRSAFALAVSSYGSPAAIAPPARVRIAIERTRRTCLDGFMQILLKDPLSGVLIRSCALDHAVTAGAQTSGSPTRLHNSSPPRNSSHVKRQLAHQGLGCFRDSPSRRDTASQSHPTDAWFQRPGPV